MVFEAFLSKKDGLRNEHRRKKEVLKTTKNKDFLKKGRYFGAANDEKEGISVKNKDFLKIDRYFLKKGCMSVKKCLFFFETLEKFPRFLAGSSIRKKEKEKRVEETVVHANHEQKKS